MTAAQIDDLLIKELDISGTWFTPSERKELLQNAYEEIINGFANRYEVDEKARAALRKLVKDSAPFAGATIDLTVISGLSRILRIKGDFVVTCNGKSQTVNRSIHPVQNDDTDEEDAFAYGDNLNPNYEEADNKLTINSESAPTNVVIRYLKIPVPIDPVGAPSVEPEIHPDEHRSIAFVARDKGLENIESKRYPQSKNETINSLTS